MLVARELIQAAQDQTALQDFGDDYFREGLEKYVTCINRDLRLSDYGKKAARGRIVSYLVNRLQIEDWYRRHPEIDDEQIVAPLFGLGLPRTGSTVFQCLLAEEPAARSLRSWESEKPCPPPETATYHTDPRIAEIGAGMEEYYRLVPMIPKMLPLEGPTDPVECHDLLGLSHRSQSFLAALMGNYMEWLINCDMVPAYRYHKRALKLLQWRCPPNRWRLKSPVHMLNMDALNTVYPDARFVMTHRDVADSLPSMAALLNAMEGAFMEQSNAFECGRIVAWLWEIALKRFAEFRARHGEKRFYDVGFPEIQSDPIGAVRRLYAWLGEPFTPEYERRLGAWGADHPKRKHGDYKIVPEDYGLSVDALRRQYRFYLDRYSTVIAGHRV